MIVPHLKGGLGNQLFQIAASYAHSLDGGLSIRAEVLAMSFDDVTTNNGKAISANRNDINVDSMYGVRGTISLVKSF